mgnify:CR=1 FL=1|jgi:uncharacterized UPF0160 family protein
MADVQITHLVTHSGAFHADEVCAAAILTALYPDAQIVRTRDAALIEELAPSAIIFDVGDVFDHAQRRYDHHQKGNPMRDGGKVPYSSFGLIWGHYGWDYMLKHIGLNALHAAPVAHAFDMGFVLDIDALDNGAIQPGQEALLHAAALPALIVDQRPDFDNDDPDAMDQAFLAAVDLARVVISAKLRKIAADQRSDNIVRRALRDRTHRRYIELPRGMSYDEIIHELRAEDVLFVINPSNGEWQLNTVAQTLGQYGARKDLPAAWAGLRNEALAEKCGVADAVFCHQARFIAVAKSREGIMAMLMQALAD